MSETVVTQNPSTIVTEGNGDDSKVVVVAENRPFHDHYHMAERIKDLMTTEHAQLVEDVKEAQYVVENAKTKILDTVREVGSDNLLATKDAEIKSVEIIKDAERVNLTATKNAELNLERLIKNDELAMERSGDYTRKVTADGFKEQLFRGQKETSKVIDNIKLVRQDILLEEKETQKLTQSLFLENERLDSKRHMDIMLAFKDETLRLEQFSKENSLQHCRIEELIRFDGQKTRDIINQREEQNLRDRLADKDRMLAAYFTRGVPPAMP